MTGAMAFNYMFDVVVILLVHGEVKGFATKVVEKVA